MWRRCLSSTSRRHTIQPRQGGLNKRRQAFIQPHTWWKGTQGGSKLSGSVWLGGKVSERSDVDADGEQDIVGLRQTAEGLSFHAQPECVPGILWRNVSIGPCSTMSGRLKKGRVVHQGPVEPPDGPLDFQPVKKLVHGGGKLFCIAGNRRMNRIKRLANFVR